MKIKHLTFIAMIAILAVSCNNAKKQAPETQPEAKLIDKYAEYTLTTDISHLSENEREMPTSWKTSSGRRTMATKPS